MESTTEGADMLYHQILSSDHAIPGPSPAPPVCGYCHQYTTTTFGVVGGVALCQPATSTALDCHRLVTAAQRLVDGLWWDGERWVSADEHPYTVRYRTGAVAS